MILRLEGTAKEIAEKVFSAVYVQHGDARGLAVIVVQEDSESPDDFARTLRELKASDLENASTVDLSRAAMYTRLPGE